MNSLQEIAKEVAVCTACPLAKSRTRTVPGAGADSAAIMFIGEAPGYYEDQQGVPFVGPAGRFLEQLLASVDLQRDQVFITNVVKCRPQGNRDPLPVEINTCTNQFLKRQIELIAPKVVVTLGRYSLAYFLPNEPISKVHGKPQKVGDRVVFPMYHPAAALHQQRYRQIIIEDMKGLPDLLVEKPQESQPAPSQDKQLPMF